MTSVCEINDLPALSAYRPTWEALLAQTPGATFFHSLDWLETYWKHFGGRQNLRVLAVHHNGHCTGILPLVVRHEQRRIGAVRVLTYPLDNWGSFYGPIGPDPATTLQAAFEHIRLAKRDWDLVELPFVDALGCDEGRTLAAMTAAGLRVQSEPQQVSSLIDLSGCGPWKNYWASRSSRWRNNVRRSEKKLAERGSVAYVRYRPLGTLARDSDPKWPWYEACETIAAASWQGASQTGTTLTHDAIRPFLREMHQVAARAGALDLNLLFVDGESVAFNYAYHYRGQVFGLRTGFAAQLASEGAGSVLQARMIEDSFARGDRSYDLGPGYLDCKRYWQTDVRAAYRYTYFPGNARAQIIRLKRRLEHWLGRKDLRIQSKTPKTSA